MCCETLSLGKGSQHNKIIRRDKMERDYSIVNCNAVIKEGCIIDDETGDIMIPMTIKNLSSDSIVNFMGNTYTTLRKEDYIISEDNGKEVVIINPRNNIVVEYASKVNRQYICTLEEGKLSVNLNRGIVSMDSTNILIAYGLGMLLLTVLGRMYGKL